NTANLRYVSQGAAAVTFRKVEISSVVVGATSGSVSVAAQGDDVYQDGETVSVSIDSATGGNFENLVPSTTAAETVVTDTTDNVTVTISGDTSVSEGDTATYTVSLTHRSEEPRVGTLSSGETITNADSATSGSVSVAAQGDDVYQDGETVSVSIDSATGGNFENLVPSTTAAETVVTDTTDNVTVTISGDTSVSEGDKATYTVSLTHAVTNSPVTVTLTYSGTAADGTDFTGVATVTIPVGASSANFDVTTIDDSIAEGAENFTVTIDTATGGNFENLVVSSTNNTVTTGVADNDTATVSLAATPTLTEAGGNIVYTATLTEAPITPLTVTLSNGETIIIAAGALS